MPRTICKRDYCGTAVKPGQQRCPEHHADYIVPRNKSREAAKVRCEDCGQQASWGYTTCGNCRQHREQQEAFRATAEFIAERAAERDRTAEEQREKAKADDLAFYVDLRGDVLHGHKEPKEAMIDLLQYIIDRKS